MAMPDTARRYTVDEVLAFSSDGNRYELVDGALLVTPAPRSRHQTVAGEVYGRLYRYLAEPATGVRVGFLSSGIRSPGGGLGQPDVFVVPAEQLAAQDWSGVHALLLAVEVVSPSSSRYDRVTKRRVYQRQRVATYWVVDPDAGVVEVWHPDDDRPEIVTDVLRWQAAREAPELEIPLDEVFRDV